MITLKDLNTLLKHLHLANEIFDTEAILEEKKHKDNPVALQKEHRKGYASRSDVLHGKAQLAEHIKDILLCEYDRTVVSLEEDTIYQARELITESMYPWIQRKEPPVKGIDELLEDTTFIPFSSGLQTKRNKLLASHIRILNLPSTLELAIHTLLTQNKDTDQQEVTVTVGDILQYGIYSLSESITFDTSNDISLEKLLFFKLYILGLVERKEYELPLARM